MDLLSAISARSAYPINGANVCPIVADNATWWCFSFGAPSEIVPQRVSMKTAESIVLEKDREIISLPEETTIHDPLQYVVAKNGRRGHGHPKRDFHGYLDFARSGVNYS